MSYQLKALAEQLRPTPDRFDPRRFFSFRTAELSWCHAGFCNGYRVYFSNFVWSRRRGHGRAKERGIDKRYLCSIIGVVVRQDRWSNFENSCDSSWEIADLMETAFSLLLSLFQNLLNSHAIYICGGAFFGRLRVCRESARIETTVYFHRSASEIRNDCPAAADIFELPRGEVLALSFCSA